MIVFFFYQWQQGVKCGFNIVYQCYVDFVVCVNIVWVDVNLNDFGIVWIKGVIGELGVEQDQCIGVYYGVEVRREVNQVGYFYIIRVIVFNVFFVVQGMNDWCFQFCC